PFLRPEGIKAIEEQGAFVKGEDGEWETPLVDNNECAYVIFSEDGVAKCGIEAAHEAGATRWKKPISCHLYPVRTREYSEFTAVNYHKWEICDPACSLGKELKVPRYQVVKEALISKLGHGRYREVEEGPNGNTTAEWWQGPPCCRSGYRYPRRDAPATHHSGSGTPRQNRPIAPWYCETPPSFV